MFVVVINPCMPVGLFFIAFWKVHCVFKKVLVSGQPAAQNFLGWPGNLELLFSCLKLSKNMANVACFGNFESVFCGIFI